MRPELYGKYIQVLKEELVPALGCTEPIAVAYTAAYARNVLGEEPQIIKIVCSGNVIKNVKGVTVPNSDGMKGIEAAAALGTVGGDHKKGLEVLNGIKKSHIDKAKQIIKEKRISCELNAGADKLYISARAEKGKKSAVVTVIGSHTGVVEIRKNEIIVWKKDSLESSDKNEECLKYDNRNFMDLNGIFEFVDSVNLSDISEVLERQINYNSLIAEEGMNKPYGMCVGRILMESYGDDLKHKVIAYAAAGADARMSGC